MATNQRLLKLKKIGWLLACTIVGKVKVKSFPEPQGPWGGADLRFL